MTPVDFITELFCRVDEVLIDCQKHSQAKLYPSEVVTIALLYALSGKGQRAFWRWLKRDYQPLFPHLPDRTRLSFACLTPIATMWTAFWLSPPFWG